jgi:putative FmdB family regulatory protein
MPMYEYECEGCGKGFTEKESFEEHDRHPVVKCPHCGGTTVHQLVTPVGVKTSRKS